MKIGETFLVTVTRGGRVKAEAKAVLEHETVEGQGYFDVVSHRGRHIPGYTNHTWPMDEDYVFAELARIAARKLRGE